MAPDRLTELWRAEVPGDVANVFLADPESRSLFVGDGWGVAYAALKLHRLDLTTGETLAQVRTRHQGVSGMTVHLGHLYAATGTRMFELELHDLSIVQQWDKGLVRYTMQLASFGSRLIAANWLMQTIGIFDPETGITKRLRVGSQPLLCPYRGEVRLIAGFDGGMWTLDHSGTLSAYNRTPAVFRAVAGEHIWATLAGSAEGGQGDPPSWTKRGTNTIVRLTGEPWEARFSGASWRLYCDDKRGLIWSINERHDQIEAVSQSTGQIVASFVAPGHQAWRHLDPSAGIALAMEPLGASPAKGIASVTGPFTVRLHKDYRSMLHCYSLETNVSSG